MAANKRPSVDGKSFDLAEHFLQEEPNVSEDEKWDLAGHIQSAVECWFSLRDPTPWCHVCGAKRKSDCECGPRADND